MKWLLVFWIYCYSDNVQDYVKATNFRTYEGAVNFLKDCDKDCYISEEDE